MKKKPNILLLFPDQHRGDWMPYSPEVWHHMGIQSLPVRMPVIQSLMEQGVTFYHAVSPSPICAPARACLASGRRYEQCGVRNNSFDYDPAIPTFYTALRDAGYQVAGTGKFDLRKNAMDWGVSGWNGWMERVGFTQGIDNAGKFDAACTGAQQPKDPYMALLHQKGWAKYHAENISQRGNATDPTLLPDELYCDNWIGMNSCRMLESFDTDKPWFLQVNFAGPHNPWDVTRSMQERWKDTAFPPPNQPEESPSHDDNRIRQNYAAMLENIDRICGELLEQVRRRGELENTIVIYASDHGELLGDFGLFGKARPERASIHIPLVISGPGIRRGVEDGSLVELQDLASTILDLCEITDSFTPDSLSLRPVLEGRGTLSRKYQVSALDGRFYWKAVQNENWKLVLTEGKLQGLYHRTDDPWENHNLMQSENREELLSAALWELFPG